MPLGYEQRRALAESIAIQSIASVSLVQDWLELAHDNVEIVWYAIHTYTATGSADHGEAVIRHWLKKQPPRPHKEA